MDEDLMMSYLEEGEEPSVEQLKACIRKGTRDLTFFPTLALHSRTREFRMSSMQWLTICPARQR